MRPPVIASLFLLTLLLSFALVLFLFVGCVGGARLGVYIRADGVVYGTIVNGTSSIQRNGDVYTFVGDVLYPLYVERDNIVIDGAGYTLVSGETRGVVLANRRNVTLQNARVIVGEGSIVDVSGAVDCALIGNTLIGNPQPIPYLPPPKTPLIGPTGVRFSNSQNITVKDNTIKNFSNALELYNSNDCTITGNTLVDGNFGIYLSDTVGCVFRNNSIVNSRFYVTVYPSYEAENDLDSSNTIDGKPIYYWKDIKDVVVPSDAAYIALLRCKNMTIENASPQGVALVSSSNSTISGLRLTGRSASVSLLNCSSISIQYSTLRDGAVAIDLQNSSNNFIRGNEFSNYITSGIRLISSSNNFISDNVFTNNSCAFSVASFQVELGSGNVIASNNFTKNSCAITVSGSMTIVGNYFEDNDQALYLSGGSGSSITQNTFKNNHESLYIYDASNNYIYLNNFLSSGHHITDAGVNNSQASVQLTKTSSSSIGFLQPATVTTHVEGVNFFPPPPPSTNHWDNGAKGNYWNDYKGSDANEDGIGDIPYNLYENNVDRYPLMKPVAIQEVPIASDSEISPTPTATNLPSSNSTSSEQQNNAETVDSIDEYTIVALPFAGAAVISAYLFLKRKKPATEPA